MVGSELPFDVWRSAAGLFNSGGPIVAVGAAGATSMGSVDDICGDAEEEGCIGIDLCLLVA